MAIDWKRYSRGLTQGSNIGLNTGDRVGAGARFPISGALPPQRQPAPPAGEPGGGQMEKMPSSDSDISRLFRKYQMTKSPMMEAGLGRLSKEWSAGGDAIPGFNELKSASLEGLGFLRDSFLNERRAYDLGGYSDVQRALDAAASGMTGKYEGAARDIGSKYAQSDEEYAKALRDVIARANASLGDYDKAANAIGDQQTNAMMGWLARAGMATPAGINSGQLQDIARGVADIRLPLEREKMAQRYNILSGLEVPSYRDIAGRNALRYSGFDLPLEQNIYGQRVGDVMRSKGTEQQLKQLEMSVAGMSRQAAESYLRSLSLPAEVIESVLQRRNQTLAGEIANLGGLGALEDQAYWRGVEYAPGMGLARNSYFNNRLAIG